MYLKNQDGLYLTQIKSVKMEALLGFRHFYINIEDLFKDHYPNKVSLSPEQFQKINKFYGSLIYLLREGERLNCLFSYTPSVTNKKGESIVNPKSKIIGQFEEHVTWCNNVLDLFKNNKNFLKEFKDLCDKDLFKYYSGLAFDTLNQIETNTNNCLKKYSTILNSTWMEEKLNDNQDINQGFLAYIKTDNDEGFLKKAMLEETFKNSVLKNCLSPNLNDGKLFKSEKDLLDNLPKEVKFNEKNQYFVIPVALDIKLKDEHLKISPSLTIQLEAVWGEQEKKNLDQQRQEKLWADFLNLEGLEEKFQQFKDGQKKKLKL